MFSGTLTYTLVHVAISLVAIASGFVVFFGLKDSSTGYSPSSPEHPFP